MGKNSLHKRAEDKLVEHPLKSKTTHSNKSMPLEHELPVHQIEPQMQKGELRRSQERLQKALSKYQDLFESAPIGYLILNTHDLIMDLNEAAAKLLQKTKAELSHQRFTQFIAKSQDYYYCRYYYEKVINAFASREVQEFDLEMTRSNDSHFFTHLNILPIQDKEGKFTQLRVALLDISERRKAEEQIEASRRSLEAVLETIPVAVVITEVTGSRFSYVNKRAKDLYGFDSTGLTLEENVAKVKPKRLDGSPYPIKELPVYSALKGQSIFNKELLLERPDGTSYPIFGSASPILDTQGNVVAAVVIFEDITERKKAEEALAKAKDELEMKIQDRTAELAQSEEKYRLLIENANEAVVVFQDKTIKFFNPKTLEITGYSQEELTSKMFTEFIHPDDRDMVVERHVKRIRGEDVPSSYEFRILRKDGNIRWVSINAVAITWQGRPAVLGLIMDVTEHIKADIARERAQKDLAEANRQLKQYGHRITQVQEEERKRIAYELHDDTAQYLSILKMQIGALVKSGKIQSPEIKEKLKYLERDADRAFNDVRRYSHELRPTALEHMGLVAALDQIAEDYNKLRQLSVKVHAEGKEPKLSEEVKLGFFRVAQEAINNTRKHAKATRATIDLRFDRKHITMTVNDNGIGFDKKEVYARSGCQGSLGLLSMRERADLINASLKIESEPGKGTKVILKAEL